MKDDLISRSALLKKAVVPFPGAFSSMISSWEVATAPAVDAVEVVYCYNCTRRDTCKLQHLLKATTFHPYCSLGERRADNG